MLLPWLSVRGVFKDPGVGGFCLCLTVTKQVTIRRQCFISLSFSEIRVMLVPFVEGEGENRT